MTTPIFYVNGPPHIGHVYTALLSDALTRTHQLASRPTHLLTGTDEHGNKVQRAAEACSMSPLDFASLQSSRYRALFDAAGVAYSTYIRTTDAHHQRVVQHAWRLMEASGDIYLGRHEGWYCTAEEAFIPLKQVLEQVNERGDRVRVNFHNGLPVEWHSEENYMFRLSKYQQRLVDWLASEPPSVQPEHHRAQVLASLSTPLPDLSISRLRSSAAWGIPVPSDPSHTIYVWFDALLNYLSACIDPASLPAPSSSSSSSPAPSTAYLAPFSPSSLWPPSVQVVGQDIVRFHAVYWPAFLLSLSLPLPQLLFAHGHWTVDGRKMSKSLGNVVDPSSILTQLGQDALRWSLLTSGTHTDDSDWCLRDMQTRYNAELAHTLGNLVNRCLAPALLPVAGLPKGPAQGALGVKEVGVVAGLVAMEEEVLDRFKRMDYQGGVQVLMKEMRVLNGYFDGEKPWEMKKRGEQERMDAVLYLCLEGCRMAAMLLQPIIPQGAARMLDRLAVPQDQRSLAHIRSGTDAARARTDGRRCRRASLLTSSLSVCCAVLSFGRDSVVFPKTSSVIFPLLPLDAQPEQKPPTSASPASKSARARQLSKAKPGVAKKTPSPAHSPAQRHTAAMQQ